MQRTEFKGHLLSCSSYQLSLFLFGQIAKVLISNPLAFQILAIYDLIVMFGCVSLYSMPELWGWFSYRVYPYALPWFLPLVQVSETKGLASLKLN